MTTIAIPARTRRTERMEEIIATLMLLFRV
jgi:hypothetical protein